MFNEAIKAAAKRANEALIATTEKYNQDLVTDEDDMTGILLGQLDARVSGSIQGLQWTTSVVRHRKGKAAEEARTGADIVMHVNLNTPTESYSKGLLIQAKRIDKQQILSAQEHKRLKNQCSQMLKITPAAFVFDYSRQGIRCGSANRIRGASSPDLYSQCEWTGYRFFLEFFRCPIGDSRLTSAKVSDLPIMNIVEFKAKVN
ncbi:hypothetical protein [Thalassospira sp.]|uniref:hypothetical protein n=1 Tax=Thalassospira sp. TaxID=1912094 RepID=UPI003AA88137